MRADQVLVERGLAASRSQAQRLIAAGARWRSPGGWRPLIKSDELPADAEIELLDAAAARYVSRGGLKLDGALRATGLAVGGWHCLDVGQSTGGFTDCLLQHDAAEVVALDVGYGQLHERLRADPRVEVRERTNIRHVAVGDLGPPFEVVVADLSFISLRTVLPAVLPLVAPGGHLVLLVKPQFEAGRAEVSRGRGVVTDPETWRRVLQEVLGALREGGAAIMGAMVSPLTGADGNVEFLVHATMAPIGGPVVDLDALVTAAVAEAERPAG